VQPSTRKGSDVAPVQEDTGKSRPSGKKRSPEVVARLADVIVKSSVTLTCDHAKDDIRELRENIRNMGTRADEVMHTFPINYPTFNVLHAYDSIHILLRLKVTKPYNILGESMFQLFLKMSV
jgi:hypothetical protein